MQKPVVKAILFDLDGTLVNTIEDIRRALSSALDLEGLPSPTAALTQQVVGRGLPNALRGTLAAFDHVVDEQRFSMLYETMITYYRNNYAVYSRPYEGIVDLLVRLHDLGIPMGIFSNKEDGLTKSIVSVLFPTFPFLWVRGMKEGFPRKPDRSGIDLFCKKLGITNQELLYVGDSEVDWQTAENAQSPHLLVSWGFRPKDELLKLQGAVVVDTVRELEDAIYGIQREGTQNQG